MGQYLAVNTLKDSLDVLKEEDKLVEYFQLLRGFEDHIFEDLQDYNGVVSLNEYYTPYFDVKLDLDTSSIVRVNLLAHAFKMKKINGWKDAIPFYLLAYRTPSTLENKDKYAWYLENELGTSYTILGDYQKAKFYYTEVEKSLSRHLEIKKNQDNLCRLWTNFGIMYESEGKYVEAIWKFKDAFIYANKNKLNLSRYSNLSELISAYLEVDNLDSARYYNNLSLPALKTIKTHPRYKLYLANYYSNVSKIKEKAGSFEQALYYLYKREKVLLSYFESNERREFAKLYYECASIYLKTDDLDNVQKYLSKGFSSLIPTFENGQLLPQEWQVNDENSFLKLLNLNASLYERKYEKIKDLKYLDSALISIDLAYIANDKLREKYVDLPSSLISVKVNKTLFNHSIKIAFKLYNITKDEKYINKARELSDRSKGIIFLDRLKEKQVIKRLNPNDKKRLHSIEQKLSNYYLITSNSIKLKDSLYLEINNLQIEVQAILNKYKSDLPQSELPNYIEYIIGEEYVYSIWYVFGEYRFIRNGRKDSLDVLLETLHEKIKQKEDISAFSMATFAFLFKNKDVQLPPSLVIIPDGNLATLPFDILTSGNEYLLENHSISYAYHNKQLFVNDDKINDKKLICLAPDYSKKSNKNNSFIGLTFTLDEVNKISSLFGTEATILNSCGKKEVKELLNTASIFHFAGHARATFNNSYLVLKNKENLPDLWYDTDIRQTRNNLDLVTLSACETGIGKHNEGEGIQSLGRSFQESGAKSCLISLWQVNDKATSEIMKLFYTNLKNGDKKNIALQNAKKSFIKNAPTKMKAPYYWSGFVLVGDSNSLFERSYNWRLLLFISITLIILASIFHHFIKKT